MTYGYSGVTDFAVIMTDKYGYDSGLTLTLTADGVWRRGGGFVTDDEVEQWTQAADNGEDLEAWYIICCEALERA